MWVYHVAPFLCLKALFINDNLEVVSNHRYLGDEFDSKGSYSELCKTRA